MDFPGVIARDLLGTEIIERCAEIVALAQDRDPGQAGLEAVEDQLLIERAVVIFRNAPFGVVIGDVERIFPRPGASGFSRRDAGARLGSCDGLVRGRLQFAWIGDLDGKPRRRSGQARTKRIAHAIGPGSAPARCGRPPSPWCRPACRRRGSPRRVRAGGPSSVTRMVRVRAVPRCCIRDTTSWPT